MRILTISFRPVPSGRRRWGASRCAVRVNNLALTCRGIYIFFEKLDGGEYMIKKLAIFLPLMLSIVFATEITIATPKIDESGCYLISNANELYGFAAIVNETDGMTKDSSVCGKLIADIVINQNVLNENDSLSSDSSTFVQWTPIASFPGSFDGQGYKISGLYFNNDTTSQVGFLGETWRYSVILKNLGIVDSYIKGSWYVGGFAGYLGHATIANCYYDGVVKGLDRVGGFVGESVSTLTITDSYHSGLVVGSANIGGLIGMASKDSLTIINSDNKGVIVGSRDVGGLIGQGYISYLRIINCYNTASITGRGVALDIGGLIGKVYSSGSRKDQFIIEDCYNEGNVVGDQYVGGLIGDQYHHNTLSMNNCYNKGSVSAKENSLGGLIGHAYNATITNSYNEGDAIAEGGFAGGLVGFVDTSFTYLIIDNCYNTGLVGGTYRTGGLVGSASLAKTQISNSYNTGDVNASLGRYVGGIIGGVSTTLSITNTFNSGSVKGLSEVGGIVGYHTSLISEITINNCYNTGSVSGDSLVGGLAGGAFAHESILITNSYSIGVVNGLNNYIDGLVGNIKVATLINTYYLNTVSSGASDGISATTEEFADGSVAAALHDYKSASVDGTIWTQNVGSDLYPVFDEEVKKALFFNTQPRKIQNSQLTVKSIGHNLFISGVRIDARYAVIDIQGRLVLQGKADVTNFSLTVPHAGRYIIRTGKESQIVSVK